MDYTLLLDAPGEPASRIQIAKLGDFDNPKYGEFSITRDDVEAWKRNLAHLPGQRALIDLDHQADRTPRRTEAAGWITGVDFDGDTPVAQVEWTPVGEQAIKDKRYLFFSPTYGAHKDEQGTVHENTLIGGALTNRPFLNMPAVTLASEERVSAARAEWITDWIQQGSAASASGSDSRASSMNPELLTLLDLDETADETKILEAVTELKTKLDEKPAAPAKPETKTLEQQAAEQGMMILDAERVTKLVADATAGRKAATELHEERRDRVWTRALEAMVRVPAQEDSFLKQYELDADTTVTAIDEDIKAGRKLLNAKPEGKGGEEEDGPVTLASLIDKKLAELGDGATYNDAYLKVLDDVDKGLVQL